MAICITKKNVPEKGDIVESVIFDGFDAVNIVFENGKRVVCHIWSEDRKSVKEDLKNRKILQKKYCRKNKLNKFKRIQKIF